MLTQDHQQAGGRSAVEVERANDGGQRAPMKNWRHDNTMVLGVDKAAAWMPLDLDHSGTMMIK